MAEVQDDDDDIFVYDGTQPVPDEVRRARMHKSVKIVRARAFYRRQHLISVEFHDGIEIIEEYAFCNCPSLSGLINLMGVKIIQKYAFCGCHVTGIEFGDKLETIEQYVFSSCIGLEKIRIPTVKTVGRWAFADCDELSDVEFGEGLRTIQEYAFNNSPKLERIALPLKGDMIEEDVLGWCPKLSTVDLVGGIHQTVASLHMESWRSEMTGEINSINQTLPTFSGGKTESIQQWMESTLRQLNHYKDEHKALMKEATTLLDLALWKANIYGNNGGEGEGVRTAGEVESSRDEIRYTSGADVVIKNVLPFLALK